MDLYLTAGTLFWIIGGLITIFLAAFSYIGTRVGTKVSKDVFAQFEKRNEENHHHTHNILNTSIRDNKEAHSRVIRLLDGKQDK